MAPNPITNLTVKVGKAERLVLALYDQLGDPMIDYVSWVVANPSIVEVTRDTIEDVKIKGLVPGATTITFTCHGISKVLNVTVVYAIPTTLDLIPHEA